MIKKIMVLGIVVAMKSTLVVAHDIAVDCDAGDSLANAVAGAEAGTTISVSGTCNELVVITQDNLTLDGAGHDATDNATITGENVFPPGSVITAHGVRGLHLKGLNIKNGLHGLSVNGAASIHMDHVVVRNNIVMGVLMSQNSLLSIKDSQVISNGVNGLDVEGNSEVQVNGSVEVMENNVFGINVLGSSSVSISDAHVKANKNTIGIQIGIGSSLFIQNADTLVETNENNSVGTTVVSGSSLFLFEGSLVSNHNGLRGLSAFTNCNIDLDRSASITAIGNALDGVALEDTIVNMFTMPGGDEPRLEVRENARHGVVALLNSRFDMNFGELISTNNSGAGFWADNGSAIRILNATIIDNAEDKDLLLTFGARAEISASDIGDASCDKTVLLRGDTEIKCKKPEEDD